jgi:hypothetical protein
MAVDTKKKQDKATRAIYKALKAAFPELPEDIGRVVYRYNPVAIRLLVVDRRFDGLSTAERYKLVSDALESLPESVMADISMTVMRTPREMADAAKNGDLIYLEFEDPARSDL